MQSKASKRHKVAGKCTDNG